MTETPAAVLFDWLPREPPLEPRAVVAEEEAAHRLAARLLERPDESLGSLQGVSGPGLLILLGPADDLPWVDGASYLGRDDSAPSLLLPTALRPSLPVALLERAVRRQFADAAPPVALLPGTARVVSVAPARAVDRKSLLAWREAQAR